MAETRETMDSTPTKRASSKMNRRFLPCAALLCLACAPGTFAASQQASEPAAGKPTIELNVNRVLVPVVVRDKDGHVIADLKQEDFQVSDNDKPRAISAFRVEQRAAPKTDVAANPSTGAQPGTAVAETAQASVLPKRIVVFLFDDLHLSASDLIYSKKAAVNALDNALDDAGMAAVVTISGTANSGLTTDRAKLESTIAGLQTRSIYHSDAAECPKISYYQADLMENKRDNVAVSEAIGQVFRCDPGLDPARDYSVAQSEAESTARRVLNFGSQDVRLTFSGIAEFVRRISAMPGQRTIILVSPGFLNVEQEAMTAEQRIIELAALSGVTISALDARGLYTTELTASERYRGGNQLEYLRTVTKLSEAPMSELANGTGGTFVANNNDLDAGFKALTRAPEAIYILELSLDNIKPDGSYHRLKVKVDRAGTRIEAREGYLIPKLEKNRK